jgi:alanyl-tRNA synthetase
MEALLQVKDSVQQALGGGIIVLGAVLDGHPQFVAAMTKDLIRPSLDAVSLVKEVSAITGGGGGGRPELARAGGRDVSKVDAALERAAEVVRSALGA